MPTIRCNTVVAPLLGLALVPATACAEYYFDPALLQGSDFGKSLDLDRFNQRDNALPAGDYVLDVYLNNQLIRRQASIALVKPEGDKTEVQPCLSPELIAVSAIRTTQNAAPNLCLPIDSLGPKITWEVDLSSLRLNMVVPQAGLLHSPRGFIPVSEWDAGETALFLRHNTNFYHTENTDSHLRYDYLWSNINSGLNLGLWQVRHQGNLRYADDNQTGDTTNTMRLPPRYNGLYRNWTASLPSATTTPTAVCLAICHSMASSSALTNACGRRANEAMPRKCAASPPRRPMWLFASREKSFTKQPSRPAPS